MAHDSKLTRISLGKMQAAFKSGGPYLWQPIKKKYETETVEIAIDLPTLRVHLGLANLRKSLHLQADANNRSRAVNSAIDTVKMVRYALTLAFMIMRWTGRLGSRAKGLEL